MARVLAPSWTFCSGTSTRTIVHQAGAQFKAHLLTSAHFNHRASIKTRNSVRRCIGEVTTENATVEEEEEEEEEVPMLDGSISPDADISSIVEWELDFCSRPIFDERGKKLWELVVCDSRRQLEFSRFYPNNVINSVTLKEALLEIIETFGLPKPAKIRFFRSQVQTIIRKACTELNIKAVASNRCVTLIRWLTERYNEVYRKHPGFQMNATSLFVSEPSFPSPVPSRFQGDKWAFVQLPFKDLQEEIKAVKKGTSVGSVFSSDVLENLPADTLIPGVAVASERAMPLSAWTNALELASLDVDKKRCCLILSTGASERWIYAYYRKNERSDDEADAWENSKQSSGGLHFLAVQPSLESEFCEGLWLMYGIMSPPV